MSDKYNGWTNYETWNAALWLDTDYYEEIAKNVYEIAGALAEFIKRDQEELMPEMPQSGMFTDLLNKSFAEINWFEIAEHILEDIDEED